MSIESELLGEMLRQERSRRGLSMREAAIECGVTPSTLVRVEHHQPPSFDSFVAIARWLKLDSLSQLSNAGTEG